MASVWCHLRATRLQSRQSPNFRVSPASLNVSAWGRVEVKCQRENPSVPKVSFLLSDSYGVTSWANGPCPIRWWDCNMCSGYSLEVGPRALADELGMGNQWYFQVSKHKPLVGCDVIP